MKDIWSTLEFSFIKRCVLLCTSLFLLKKKNFYNLSSKFYNKNVKESDIFTGTFGRFSKQTYEQILRDNNLTPEQYEDALRGIIDEP